MECKKCGNENMEVQEYREEILFYNDPDNLEKIESIDYDNFTTKDSIHIVYCRNCKNIFKYNFDNGLGKKLEYVGLTTQ